LVLHFDEDHLRDLQKLCKSFVSHSIKSLITDELLKLTPLGGLMSSIKWPKMVLDRANEIDNPWSVVSDRARQTGILLARRLLHQYYGGIAGEEEQERIGEGYSIHSRSSLKGRPISLIGYGFGAKVIFECLTTLNKEGGMSARGIVENAVLIGAPVSADIADWIGARVVVADRLVNVFSDRDYLLAVMSRQKGWQVTVAGLMAIPSLDPTGHTHVHSPSLSTSHLHLHSHTSFREVENLNVSHLVGSFDQYPAALPAILSVLNLS